MRRWGRVWVPAVVTAVALATTSCGVLDTGPAQRGNGRPGVDVPSGPGNVAAAPLGLPPVAPPGAGGYAFSRVQADGFPVAFDPCRPVAFVVRPLGEPEGGAELVDWAFGQLAQATGLQFVHEGPTDEAPDPDRSRYQPDRYGDRWAPVLVAWSDPTESSLLTDDILGRAGPLTYGSGEEGGERLVSGLVVLNAPAIDLQLRTGDASKARAVLLHELGHLVGLAHVQDPYQVMFESNAYPLPSYRAGDLRGLEQLGRGPCFRDV